MPPLSPLLLDFTIQVRSSLFRLLIFPHLGRSIQDLTDDEFETDAALWQITPPPCSTCNITYQTDLNTCYTQSDLVLGGPDILTPGSTDTVTFQRTYQNLSAHAYVVFSISISYFGSKTTVPNNQPVINLLFDGVTVPGPRIATSDACSDSTSPTIVLTNFQGVAAHSSSSLTLVIQTLFPFNTIQIGFRQISLLLYTSAPYMMNSDKPSCQSSTTKPVNYDKCTCPYGQAYLNNIIWVCWGCTHPCATCFMCGSDNCYTCKDGYFWNGGQCIQTPPCCASYNGTYCSSCSAGCFNYGNGVCQAACDPNEGYYSVKILGETYCYPECPDSSQYRYLNGSCLSSCPSPLSNLSSAVNNTELNYCYNPCTSSQYLYPDGSCSSTCNTPLKKITNGGIPYCQSPCLDSTQFYFHPNSSCLNSCPTPLVTSHIQGISYCSNPCQASQYLYSNNGSCFQHCSLPFDIKSEPGVNYCTYNCKGYLSFNNTCLSECTSPFKKRIQDTILTYCDSPCSNNMTDYYYPSDGSCQNQCEYPNQATNHENGFLQICTLMVTQAETEQAEKLAKTTETSDSIASGGIIIGSLLSSSDSTSAAMGSLTKMLSYIKFMDIKFPPKLQLLFDSSSSNNSTLLSSIRDKLKDKAGNLPPPINFEKYNVPASFIINFWQSLITLGAILAVILILLILSVFIKRIFLQKILSELKWNTFLTLFYSYSGDIILFSALEFQTVQSDNIFTATSFIVCVGVNILTVYILFKILQINYSVRNKTTEDIDKSFASCKALFECYKNDSFSQQIFMFIFMIRIGLFNGIIGYLYHYPFVQAILIILINVAILTYLLFKRPMRKIINLVQQILLEGIIFAFNIGVLILAILDEQDKENLEMRENIGDMLIMINVIVPILTVVLIAIKILLILWEFYKNYKKSKAPPVNQKLPKIRIIPQTRAPSPVLTGPINTSFTTDQTNHNLLQTNSHNNSLLSVGSNIKSYSSYLFFRI